MYGMAATSTPTVSENNSRIMVVEVAGASHKHLHNSNYTVKVPLNRLSQTIQRVGRTGGKIVSINVASFEVGEITTNPVLLSPSVESVTQADFVETHTAKSSEAIEEVHTGKSPKAVEVAKVKPQDVTAPVDEQAEAVPLNQEKASSAKSKSFAKKLTEKLPKTSKRTKKSRS